MPINADGTRTARYTPEQRRAMAERKRAAMGGLYWGYDLASQGYRNAPEMGKHMYSMYGQGNDPGYYGRNFIGASENYTYDWNKGMKMNHAAPNNPDYKKWVPIEAWELKRHNNQMNAMQSNPNLRTAEDYALWRRRNAPGDVPRDPTGRAMDAPRQGDTDTDPDSETGTPTDDPIDDVSTSAHGGSMYGQGLGNLLQPPGPVNASDTYMHVPRSGTRKSVGGTLGMQTPPLKKQRNPGVMGAVLGAPMQTMGGVTNQTRRPGGAPRPPYSHYPNGVPRPGMDTYPIPGQTYNPQGSGPTFDDWWSDFKRGWWDR